MDDKTEKLTEVLKGYGKVAIALSGGLDSSTLLSFAVKTLGGENCMAITAVAPYMMREELEDAAALCKKLSVEHLTPSFEIPKIVEYNPPNRCYLCKTCVFSEIVRRAAERGFTTVADGTNADDMSDYRPGLKALAELGVKSPLLESGIGKKIISELARSLGIKIKPACACLLTRLEHGSKADPAILRKIDGAEEFLRACGFGCVRVRLHSECARIEIPKEDILRFTIPENLKKISAELSRIGFKHSALDLNGYVRGSMNSQK